MKKHGKKYRAALEKMEPGRKYNLDDAVKKLKEIAFAKFDETVELTCAGRGSAQSGSVGAGYAGFAARLGKIEISPVIAQGDKIKEAEEAGADFVGGEDMVTKIKGGWLEFDAVIATSRYDALVGDWVSAGTRGLMPNPKNRHVTFDVKTACERNKGRQGRIPRDKTASSTPRWQGFVRRKQNHETPAP